MWPWIIGSVIAAAAYEYLYKPNTAAAKAESANATGQGAPFTSPGKVHVGDIVTVSLVSVEINDVEGIESETVLMTPETKSKGSPANPSLSAADIQTMRGLDAIAETGGTADFLVTATGLVAPGGGTTPAGTSLTVGVLQGLSTRVPFRFLTASVQRIVRKGQVVS